MKTKKLAVLGMLCAMAYVVAFLAHLLPIHLVPSITFLSYDPTDTIIAIGGFFMGPQAALAITFVVSLLETLTISTTGWIGLIMNILSTAAFVCPPALLYRKSRTIKSAALGLIIGILLMSGVMLLWNWLVTPFYMGVPRETVEAMLLPMFLPFNLLKGALNMGITLLLYKPIQKALRAAVRLSDGETTEKSSAPLWIIGTVVLGITLVLVILLYVGIL